MRRILALSVPVAFGLASAFTACGGSATSNNGDGGSSSSGGQSSSSSGGLSSSSSGGQSSSSSGGGPTDASANPDGSQFVMASHLAFPQIIYGGAGIITTPKVVSVTFPGDSMATQLDAFGQGVLSSSWWKTIDQGYCEDSDGAAPCIGDGTGVAVQLTTAPASSYTDATLQTWLASQITSGTLPMPDSNPISNTIYLLYIPQTTTITFQGGQSCNDFDGYHSSMMMGSQQIIYAVSNECDFGPSMDLIQTTITSAHELIEAATDPISTDTTAGYYLNLDDPNTWGWNDIEGGEVADMCVDLFGIGQDEASDLIGGTSFTVQRIWSNAQAAAGGDPCNPVVSAKPYFNASPPQEVFVLDVGGSVTFEADAFSTGPMSDWTLLAQDLTSETTTYLSFTIEGGTESEAGPDIMVNNGSKPKITMTLLSDPGSSPTLEADGIIASYTGDFNNPTAGSFWPFIVLSPADAMDAGIDAAVSTRGTKRGRHVHSGPAARPRPGSLTQDLFTPRRHRFGF